MHAAAMGEMLRQGRCMDEVNKCAAACKDCQRVESSEPPRYVCKDRFTGQPGPMCKPRAEN